LLAFHLQNHEYWKAEALLKKLIQLVCLLKIRLFKCTASVFRRQRKIRKTSYRNSIWFLPFQAQCSSKGSSFVT